MRGQGAVEKLGAIGSESRPSGPVDMEHLSQQSLGDDGLALEVLRVFDDMARAYASRLESCTVPAEAERALHTLRAAAAGVGAFALSELAGAAEHEVAGAGEVNRERIADVAMAVEEVSAFIAERLSQAA